MSNTFWKNYNGVDVSIEPSGDFVAEVDGVFLRQSHWAHLQHRIETEKKAAAQAVKLSLDCLVLLGDQDRGEYSVRQMKITGLDRKDSTFKWNERFDKNEIILVVPFTHDNALLMHGLQKAKTKVYDIETLLKPRRMQDSRYGSRIDASKYNEETQSLQERYHKALEASQ